jgi:hypothetical protein
VNANKDVRLQFFFLHFSNIKGARLHFSWCIFPSSTFLVARARRAPAPLVPSKREHHQARSPIESPIELEAPYQRLAPSCHPESPTNDHFIHARPDVAALLEQQALVAGEGVLQLPQFMPYLEHGMLDSP